MRYLLALAALLAVAGALSTPGGPGACTDVASRGVRLDTFVNSLRPGDVGCLHAGSYGARGNRVVWRVHGTSSARITLRGHPGESRPRILAPLTLEGDYLTASGLLFEGPSGVAGSDDAIAVWIAGDQNVLIRSEVRKAESQGVYLDGAEETRLVGNYIHDNGDKDDPAVANLHHGIYFKSGSGIVAGNLIVDNYSFGVHLYPSPHDVLVEQNVIVGHGKAGVIIGGEPGDPRPANNRVVNNIVTSNGQRAVTSYGPLGAGNVVEGNVFWANGTLGDSVGLTMSDNVRRDPRDLPLADSRLRYALSLTGFHIVPR